MHATTSGFHAKNLPYGSEYLYAFEFVSLQSLFENCSENHNSALFFVNCQLYQMLDFDRFVRFDRLVLKLISIYSYIHSMEQLVLKQKCWHWQEGLS